MSRQFLTIRFDSEDYCLTPQAYSQVCTYLGLIPDIDLFASLENRRCSNFYSRYVTVDTRGIDAFFQDHWGTHFYAFPPVDDCGRFIRQFLDPTLQGSKSLKGILILPFWVRLESTSLILSESGHFIPQVRAWISLGC